MAEHLNLKEKKGEESATFFCFCIDEKIRNKGMFLFISSSDISHTVEYFDKYTILKVYTTKGFSFLNFFKNKILFKIIFKKDDIKIYESEKEFKIQNKKIKFIYNTQYCQHNLFKIPSYQNQYIAFSKLNNYKEELNSNTSKFFKIYFDLGLSLRLLEEGKKEELTQIIDNFLSLKNITFKELVYVFKGEKLDNLPEQYQTKFIIIYSAISDDINILKEKNINNSEDLEILFTYNEKQKDYKILIKKQFFSYFIKKISSSEKLKKFCNYCYSIPILFDILSKNSKPPLKIKEKLTYEDLPEIKACDDDILILIDQYEEIKIYFKNDEILRLWRSYLEKCKHNLNIRKLEEIKNKFISINREFYSSIIEEINFEISKMRRRIIIGQELKGKEMYTYINDFNTKCEFFSDEELLLKIATNIDLKDLEKNSDSLEEYNKCKFLQKLDEVKIKIFIQGILKSIKSFDELFLFLKFIYPLSPKIQDFSLKDNIITILTISTFLSILYNINNKIKFINEYQEVIQTLIILSVMYIKDDTKNDYKDFISKLGNCNAFDRDDLIDFFIKKIINFNVEKYISLEKKNVLEQYILNEFYFKLSIEKQIFFLEEIESLDFKEKNIYSVFPKLYFEDIINTEDKKSFIYLQCFIENGKYKKDINSEYLKELIQNCNLFVKKLDEKEINYSEVKKINDLIKHQKLYKRIYCICLGDESKSKELNSNIEKYVENCINYFESLDIITKYLNKYYKNTKKEEIQKYTIQQQNYKQAKDNLRDINIFQNLNEEITIFEKYEKSKFFNIFYNDLIDIKNENDKFNKAGEVLNECKNLFNEEKLEVAFLENPLSKIEDDNLINEIKYLKDYFNQNEANEILITEKLIFYKNRKKIINALNGLIFICKKLEIPNIEDTAQEIDKIIEKMKNIIYFSDISDIIPKLKNIDDNILEKDFIEILNLLYRNEKKLFNFLNSKKESEVRDLIDGLYEEENDDIPIELRDIEILINGVCFIQEIKNKSDELKILLNNFHDILKNKLYKEIISNLIHIDNKMFEFEDYIKVQLGKNVKNSNSINKFLKNGIIKFEKKSIEEGFNLVIEPKNIKSEYVANITIEKKTIKFEEFKKVVKKLMTKNIYSYGKKSHDLKKVIKIVELINEILKELNLNKKIVFEKTYEISSLEIIDQTILKIPQMERDLNELRNQNAQIKKKNFEVLYNNPSLQFANNIDLYDFDLNKKNIQNYFPNIHELDKKVDSNIKIHYNIICEKCRMSPIIGERYKCKDCNKNFCESCMKNNPKHNFIKIEDSIDPNEISYYFLNLLTITQIDKKYSDLKGIFSYKSSKDDYEIDILKIFNKFLTNSFNKNYPIAFLKKLPFFYNLLLCYENCSESEIFSFCARAINCSINSLFMIVRPEEMNIGTERFFFKTFNRILEKKNYNINSCIIILYINQSSHIIKQLIKIKENHGYPDESQLFQNIDKVKLNLKDLPIEIFTSDSPRVGKTTLIEKEINSNGKKYRSFSLGDIDQKFLSYISNHLNRIKEKQLSIVFQLYQNPDENVYLLIRNFLFKFLILKFYENFNYLSEENINIFIEVSSDYKQFDKDYKILGLFKRNNIDLKTNPNFYEEYKVLTKGNNYSKICRILSYLSLIKDGEINNTTFKKCIQSIINYVYQDSKFNEMINLYFIKKFSSGKLLPNYGQIQIFINLINDLILNFEQCKEMNPYILKKEIGKNNELESLKNIRTKIIEYYVDLVVNFSSISYESILENQEVAAENQKNIDYKLSNEHKKKLIDKLNTKRIISYNEIKPSVVLFNSQNDIDDDYKCSIITSCNEESDEYKQLEVLYVKYLMQDAHLYTITEYDDQSQYYFLNQLYNICSTSKSKREELNKEEKFKNYEFTSDNYIKMILIYLRIRAKVPLILLGETGCGKTFLIKALSYFLEDRYKFIQYNIHSGVTYQDIISFLHSNGLLVERKDDNDIKLFQLIQDEEKEEVLENPKNNNGNIILFLDEINTTNSLNLLVELFTSNSFIGYSLKENVYVIGACNPYRLMLSNNEEIGYTNKRRHRIRNLVYTVNPLPLSLINYVFDFGNLRKEEEKKYINKFINSFLFNLFENNEEKEKKGEESSNNIYEEIYNIICDAVYYCQAFIRDNSEISSVSLREIQRFKKFFEFFFDITKEKMNKNENIRDLYLNTANLALYICYYIRILDLEKREELSKKLKEILKLEFLKYPYELENYIADNMNLSKGIAKNRALLDNIFTLFVCLNAKIPIFICGKAGCSKTLSFSLLYQSMKGEYSNSELFKRYPKLYVSSYQGSLTSNSSEIQTIFKRAKNISRKAKTKKDNENKNDDNNNIEENKEKILSVILFDEMGLAEISPNNPLKVIHSELDENNDEIGFVGISNWSLDASKMNRGVHLSIQEPDEKDLIDTAKTIATGINDEINTFNDYGKIIENLAKSYYKYKKLLLEKYMIFYDFHGARDFYNLIKITARMLKSKKNSVEIAMESIERNFGGLELEDKGDNNTFINSNSSKKFKKIFSEIQKIQESNAENIDKYDVYNCVQKNLIEENNRYLLLITDKTKNDTLVEFILKKLKLDYRFIQGSKLKDDQNEGYVLQKSWSIISSMEKGEIVILKDMEILYPKFYDLFNQNLQKYGNSLYAKIVLDSTTNERHIVNDKFRCIILLNKNNVNEQDPPFLNRFEKHLISFQYLLNDEQNRIAEELYEEIKDLTTIPEIKGIKPLLVNINVEEIRSLILELSTKEENIEKNINLVYKVLIPTFSQENILSSIFSQEKKYIKKEDLIQIYEENSHTNVYKYMKKVKKNKIVIFTFSPYFKDLFKENDNVKIENEIFGNICKDNTFEIIFNEKLSENMLNYFFELYYEKKNCNLFVIHFKDKHSKYLKYIKFLLDDYHKKVKENDKKIFLFIIHIKKNKSNIEKYYSYFFSFLSEYQQITIDNIAEQKNLSIIDLFKLTNESLLLTKELFDIDIIIKKEFSRQIIGMNKNSNNSFIDDLDNLSDNGILESIIKAIQNSIKNSDNLLRQIFIDYCNLKDKDDDFISFFVEKIEKLISDNVEKLIKELVNSGYFVSFIFEKDIPEKIKKTILQFIDNINLLNPNIENNLDSYLLDLKIPGSKLLFQKFFSFLKNCKNEYINKENECRKPQKKNRKKLKLKKLL